MLRFPLILVWAGLAFCQAGPQSDAGYYPLRLGMTWTYTVQRLNDTKAKPDRVTWRVTHEDRQQSGVVYQVWPTPMQSDDEAMQLMVRQTGIEEIASKTLILKFPLKAGTVWAVRPRGQSGQRDFRVLSAGIPCKLGNVRFPKCATVEDSDEEGGLRTVTTYAYGIGPVMYTYFMRRSGHDVLVQRVTIEAEHKGDVGSQDR